jgi:hypothetical protein
LTEQPSAAPERIERPHSDLSSEAIERLRREIAAAEKLGSPADLFGVSPAVLYLFLILLRDRYPLVDKANFFLELEQGTSGINVAITNQRDALSHLVTLLTRTDLTADQQLSQLAHAEEHLRRATFEPYAIAIQIETKKLLTVRTAFQDEVLPLADDPRLSTAPDLTQVNAMLKEIRETLTMSRQSKARNTWDAGWEDGVASLVALFTKARQMHERLVGHIAVARLIREEQRQAEQRSNQSAESVRQRTLEKRNRFLTILSIVLGMLGILLTILLAI